MSDVLREAWRRVKHGEPLDPEHVRAQREYNAKRARENARPTLPADVAHLAEQRAGELGLSRSQYLANLVHQEAQGNLVSKQLLLAEMKAREQAQRKAEAQNDTFRERMLEDAERARRAVTAQHQTEEEMLAAWERMIATLDFLGVPEAEDFLEKTARDMKNGGHAATG